jgi:fused signal recognition particle receptor
VSFFTRLKDSLQRTKEQIFTTLEEAPQAQGASPAAAGVATPGIYSLDALEEALISCDIGVAATARIVDAVRGRSRRGDDLLPIVREEILAILEGAAPPPGPGGPPRVVLIVGVNGTGKTTSIGKLANLLKQQGQRPLVCAADTFRAAAVEQLEVWTARAEVGFIRAKAGADPAAVVFDAITAARARGLDPLLIDTAGRLHTRVNLMNELEKIKRVAAREVEGAPHEVLLVLDATVGQNGVAQAREFMKVSGVNGIILTKLDGTAKGGVAVAIAQDLGLPIRYVGTGEQIDDLVPFAPREYVDALFETAW